LSWKCRCTRTHRFAHLAPLLVRMEEVAGVVWGDIAAVARETTCEPLAAPPLGLNCRALGSGGQNEMSYSCTSKCVLFEISLAVVCWLLRVQLVQNLRQPRGNSARGAPGTVVILGPMAVNPFQGSRWLLHTNADRHKVHGVKSR
jgi:hypothetical protein